MYKIGLLTIISLLLINCSKKHNDEDDVLKTYVIVNDIGDTIKINAEDVYGYTTSTYEDIYAFKINDSIVERYPVEKVRSFNVIK